MLHGYVDDVIISVMKNLRIDIPCHVGEKNKDVMENVS